MWSAAAFTPKCAKTTTQPKKVCSFRWRILVQIMCARNLRAWSIAVQIAGLIWPLEKSKLCPPRIISWGVLWWMLTPAPRWKAFMWLAKMQGARMALTDWAGMAWPTLRFMAGSRAILWGKISRKWGRCAQLMRIFWPLRSNEPAIHLPMPPRRSSLCVKNCRKQCGKTSA